MRDELRERMLQLREGCECGDPRAYVRLRIIIGENRERRAAWRREHPEVPQKTHRNRGRRSWSSALNFGLAVSSARDPS